MGHKRWLHDHQYCPPAGARLQRALLLHPAVVAVSADSGISSLDGLSGQAVCAGAATTYEAWLNNDAEGLPKSSIYSPVPADVTVVPLETIRNVPSRSPQDAPISSLM